MLSCLSFGHDQYVRMADEARLLLLGCCAWWCVAAASTIPRTACARPPPLLPGRLRGGCGCGDGIEPLRCEGGTRDGSFTATVDELDREIDAAQAKVAALGDLHEDQPDDDEQGLELDATRWLKTRVGDNGSVETHGMSAMERISALEARKNELEVCSARGFSSRHFCSAILHLAHPVRRIEPHSCSVHTYVYTYMHTYMYARAHTHTHTHTHTHRVHSRGIFFRIWRRLPLTSR